MKKALLLIIVFLSFKVFSQPSQSNRFRFRYRISASKFKTMRDYYVIRLKRKHFFYDAKSDVKAGTYNDLDLTDKLKCLIALDNSGNLSIDPWSHVSSSISSFAGIPDTAVTPFTMEIARHSFSEPTQIWWIPYQATVLGFNSISLKFRPKVTSLKADGSSQETVGNATANFSLGASLGHTFGWTQFTHRAANSWSGTLSGFLSFTAIDVATQPIKKLLPVGIDPNEVVLSPGFCLILARNDIGITLAYGWDLALGKYNKYWAYQGKHFFGIGLVAGIK